MRCPNCQVELPAPIERDGAPYQAYPCRACRSTIITAAPGQAWQLPALKVLIVDDDAASRDVLALTLQQLGSEVIVSADGPEGMSRAFGERPDVVFMDLQLTGAACDGLESIRVLQAATRALTVFAYTMGPLKAVDAIAAGAQDALIKPFQRSELIDLLMRHFSAPLPLTT